MSKDVLIQSIMESEHANTDARANTTRATLDLEPITVLHNPSDLKFNVTGIRRREWDISARRSLILIFLLNHLFELLGKSVAASDGRLFRIHLCKFSAHILLQCLLHW